DGSFPSCAGGQDEAESDSDRDADEEEKIPMTCESSHVDENEADKKHFKPLDPIGNQDNRGDRGDLRDGKKRISPDELMEVTPCHKYEEEGHWQR
ncbi:unnamed protein product, partial [Prorocentrum cordatum]